MKILSKIVCCFLVCLPSYAASCPENFFTELHHFLKPKVAGVTWMDINAQELPDSCAFTIRYFPCTAVIQEQINELLPQAIELSSRGNCRLLNSGIHEPTEGYCSLKNITINCS